MRYFNFETVADKYGISPEKLKEWMEIFQYEYPGDEMMIELRMLRACEAANPDFLGILSVDKALVSESLKK